MNNTDRLDQTPDGYRDRRAAAAKYEPAPKDTLATVQYLVVRAARGELTWTVTAEQRRIARLYFDVDLD